MIRFTYKFLKPVALFLSVVVIFQCCVVYDKKPVTIEEAINKNHKVQKQIMLELTNGYEMILDSLYYRDNKLYGSKITSEKETIIIPTYTETKYTSDNEPYTYLNSTIKTVRVRDELLINENEIAKIRLYNRTKVITRYVFLGIAVAVPLGIYIGNQMTDYGDEGFTINIL